MIFAHGWVKHFYHENFVYFLVFPGNSCADFSECPTCWMIAEATVPHKTTSIQLKLPDLGFRETVVSFTDSEVFQITLKGNFENSAFLNFFLAPVPNFLGIYSNVGFEGKVCDESGTFSWPLIS